MPVCKLCLEDKELCKSHIIPKHFFRNREYGNGFYQIDCKSPIKKFIRQGWYEKLLCRSCEEHIGEFDNYSAIFFQSFPGWNKKKIGKYNLYEIENYDYKMLKLFLISILWRAGVSKIDAFESVSLGRYENILRKMILAREIGNYKDFCFAFFVKEPVQDDLHKITFSPIRKKIDGVNYYSIDINEFEIYIKVDQRNQTDAFCNLALSKNSPLFVIEVPYYEKRHETISTILNFQQKNYQTFRASFE